MTGQLAVPLHHVERVGDIAVLPKPCASCSGTGWDGIGETVLDYDVCADCDGQPFAVPVVGQVVAHVEKCATCEGTGEIEIGTGSVTGDPVVFPCGPCGPPDHLITEHNAFARGSGWVRDQYVRVIEVLGIHGPDSVTDARPRHIYVRGNTTLLMWWEDGAGWYEQRIDLPGAVPGGTALVVEPAECPTCDGTRIDGSRDAAAFYAYSGKVTSCDDCLFPVPVSAPSAPYAESGE